MIASHHKLHPFLINKIQQAESSYLNYSKASFICGLIKFAALTAFVVFLIKFVIIGFLNHNYPSFQNGYCLLGTFIGGMIFRKIHNKLSKKAEISEIELKCGKNLLGITHSPGHFEKFIKKIEKIERVASICFFVMCLGLFLSNRAQTKILPKCFDEVPIHTHAHIALKYKIGASPIVCIPFKGVCWGASLHFAQRYSMIKNAEEVMKEFAEGVPFEALVLQGQASNLRITLNQSLVNDKNQLLINKELIMGEIAGFDSKTSIGAKENLAGKIIDDGIYTVSFESNPGPGHATLLIKEGETYKMYDPNNSELCVMKKPIDIFNYLQKIYELKQGKHQFILSQLTPLAAADPNNHG